MPTLVLVLGLLVAAATLYEVARRIGVPYPTVLVLGGVVPVYNVPGVDPGTRLSFSGPVLADIFLGATADKVVEEAL